jgi:hypothetical protein
LCPVDGDDKTEGTCDAELSEHNADSWSFVAAGVYFSNECNKAIPTPDPPAAKVKKRDSCPIIDDYIVWDGDEMLSIEGYVHFGDSYAAGMGTGNTSTDSCRVGSNNYGTLLYQWFNDSTIPYESKACSGDTTTGLNRQIKEWSNPTVPNIGTVTMGGNDLDFTNMVYYCVITPNTWWTGGQNRRWCLEYEEKARSLMNDTSSDGLTYKLKEAYKSILSKSGRKVSKQAL